MECWQDGSYWFRTLLYLIVAGLAPFMSSYIKSTIYKSIIKYMLKKTDELEKRD